VKIAAILSLKDEAELLEACIGNLRRIGVDHIIGFDAGSTDGSLRIMERHRARGGFEIFPIDDRDPDPGRWNREQRRLALESDADWILFLDADEFWLPATGSLRDCADLDGADVIRVPRYNVPLGEHGPLAPPPERFDLLHSVHLLVERAAPPLADALPGSWLLNVPVPKVMVRRVCIGAITDAGHDIVPPPGKTLRRAVPRDLLTAHLPFSTLSRFARKVENVQRMMPANDAYFVKNRASHWRDWCALGDADAVRAEFERQVLPAETIARCRAAGILRSAGELLGR
jgi:glycosyltransferase involved in cell wall biosynthesis